MTTTKAASYLTTYMKTDSRTPIIHQAVGLVSGLLIDHHKNIKDSPAAIIHAALFARISSSELRRVERGLSHPRRLSTLSLPERDPHASGKSLYGCPHSQHASDATIRLNQTLSWVRKLLLVFPSLRNPLRAVTATEGKMHNKYLPGSGNQAHKAVCGLIADRGAKLNPVTPSFTEHGIIPRANRVRAFAEKGTKVFKDW